MLQLAQNAEQSMHMHGAEQDNNGILSLTQQKHGMGWQCGVFKRRLQVTRLATTIQQEHHSIQLIPCLHTGSADKNARATNVD